jgi:hypothetical protein
VAAMKKLCLVLTFLFLFALQTGYSNTGAEMQHRVSAGFGKIPDIPKMFKNYSSYSLAYDFNFRQWFSLGAFVMRNQYTGLYDFRSSRTTKTHNDMKFYGCRTQFYRFWGDRGRVYFCLGGGWLIEDKHKKAVDWTAESELYKGFGSMLGVGMEYSIYKGFVCFLDVHFIFESENVTQANYGLSVRF